MRENPDYEKYGILDNPETERLHRRRGIWIAVISVLLVIVLAITAGLCVKYYVIATIPVSGDSMFPTLNNEDLLYLNKVAKIERDDIVVFVKEPATEDTPEVKYVKRVIGVAGDVISIANDVIYRNGEVIEDNYNQEEKFRSYGSISNVTVPYGYIYVLGDNRQHSSDSREFGCVEMSTVVGKVFLVKRVADGSLAWIK